MSLEYKYNKNKKSFSLGVHSALHYCCGQLDLVAAASITTAAPDLLESADEDGKHDSQFLHFKRFRFFFILINIFHPGLTPLHLAVIQGNTALVNLLIANKANVNAIDNEGHSVVHWAAGEFITALLLLLTHFVDSKVPSIPCVCVF